MGQKNRETDPSIPAKKKKKTKAQEIADRLDSERSETNAKLDSKPPSRAKAPPAAKSLPKSVSPASKSPSKSVQSQGIPLGAPLRSKIVGQYGMPLTTASSKSVSSYLGKTASRRVVEEQKLDPELEQYMYKRQEKPSETNYWLSPPTLRSNAGPKIGGASWTQNDGIECSMNVDELVNMGFDKEKATQALQRTRGNVALAVTQLLDG